MSTYNLISIIVSVKTFVIFLMIYGLLLIEQDFYDSNISMKKQDFRIFLLSTFAALTVLLVNLFADHYLSHFLTVIIIINILIISSSLKDKIYIFLFYGIVIGTILLINEYTLNDLLNVYMVIVLMIIRLLITFLKQFKFEYKGYILTNCILSIVMMLNVYLEFQDLLYLILYLLITIISVALFSIIHFIVFYHNNQLFNFYINATYDLESNTFSANYLNTQLNSLKRNKQHYTIMFIDIIKRKNIRIYDGERKSIIEELTQIIKNEITQDDTFGRLHPKRFCIIFIKDLEQVDQKVESIRNQIKQIVKEHIQYEITVKSN